MNLNFSPEFLTDCGAPIPIQIESALSEDLPEILELQYRCYEAEAALYPTATLSPQTQTLDQLQEQSTSHHFLIARQGSHILGSVRARLSGVHCDIGRLIVDPDFQSQGIGARLLQAIEKHFSTALRYRIFAGSRSESALHLFRRLGYSEYRHEQVNSALELIHFHKVRSDHSEH